MRKNKHKGAGRPPYEPTKNERHKVSVCAAGGMAHEEIALALGISRNTLEKYFEHELSKGAYERRAEVLQALHRVAKKGNVAACKALLAMSPELAAPPAPKPDEKPAAPLGKKEQAQADAVEAAQGTAWHDDLPRHPSTRH